MNGCGKASEAPPRSQETGGTSWMCVCVRAYIHVCLLVRVSARANSWEKAPE